MQTLKKKPRTVKKLVASVSEYNRQKGGFAMKNRSEWDTFYQSGKVEDYLTYCHKKEKRETVEPDRGLKEKDAEFYSGFRSGVEGRTDWGI